MNTRIRHLIPFAGYMATIRSEPDAAVH